VPVEETEVVTTSCPAIPRNVIATGGDNSIVLTWDEPDEGTAAPTAYVATVMPGEIEFRIDAPSTTALLGGLLNGKSYEVYLSNTNQRP
jgi:hypothetical protein